MTANGFTDGDSKFPYLTWKFRTEYVTNLGLLQGPLASSGPKVETPIIKASAPYSCKIVHFVIERQGVPPILPHPAGNDPNAVYAGHRFIFDSPDIMAECVQKVYRVEGTIWYMLKTPMFAGDTIKLGGTPFIVGAQDHIQSNVWFTDITP